MRRWNHYEAAFEAFLRERHIPFLGIEERLRNRMEDGSTLKSLDFIISPPGGSSWLVDVKGRKFPAGSGKSQHGYWKHWSTRDDLIGLRHWERLFGRHFSGLFVFAYLICGDRSPLPPDRLFEFKNRVYAFVGISVDDYLPEVRLLSPRWQTYSMSVQRFKALARPVEDFFVPEDRR